jgi:hypothetical protein
MSNILIPHLVAGEIVHKKLAVSDYDKMAIRLLGFRFKNGVLEWDCTYMMSDDPETFKEGEHQRETINMILKADI